MALPPSLRFPNQRAVQGVLRRGVRIATPLGRGVFRRVSGTPKVLFVISKRVAKKSTVRNRMKRTLDAWLTQSGFAKQFSAEGVIYIASQFAGATREAMISAATETFRFLTRRFPPYSP